MEDDIVLVIQADNLPELTEITEVVLTDVIVDGVSSMTAQIEGEVQGAYIDDASMIAVISVAANDFPHGQITWDSTSLLIMVPEPNDTEVAVELILIRLSGAIGDILITYRSVRYRVMTVQSMLDFLQYCQCLSNSWGRLYLHIWYCWNDG